MDNRDLILVTHHLFDTEQVSEREEEELEDFKFEEDKEEKCLSLFDSVMLECIGESSDFEEVKTCQNHFSFCGSVSRVSQKTQLETVGEDIFEDNEEEEEIILEESRDHHEEFVFEKQLIKFAAELKISISKESSEEDLQFVSSYFTFIKFGRIFVPEPPCPNLSSQFQKSEIHSKLKEISVETKIKSVDLIIEAFDLMSRRKISEVFSLLEEARKKQEKEFCSSDFNMREKIFISKIGIFVECLTKCYNPEKGIFLPSELLPMGKKEKIRKKLVSYHQKLKDSLGRKRSDSQWRKFGKSTIERSKENVLESGFMDDFYRCIYPLYSEASNFTSNLNIIETNSNFQISLDQSLLPKDEENHAVVCIGVIEDDDVLLDDDDEVDEETLGFSPVYLFIWKTKFALNLRTKQLLCQTYQDATQDILEVEMCLDDNQEIEMATVLADTEWKFECKAECPASTGTDLLAEAMEGRVEPKLFREIRRLGKFYLETAFDYELYRIDEERRTLAHYLAWLGKEDPLVDLLTVLPTFLNFQDIYGETPLMYAVRGGKACLTVVRTLLNMNTSTELMLDLQNIEGDTAAHLAVRFNDIFLIELLLKAGADPTIKNKEGKLMVECLPPGSKESQRKPIGSLVKKYKK